MATAILVYSYSYTLHTRCRKTWSTKIICCFLSSRFKS